MMTWLGLALYRNSTGSFVKRLNKNQSNGNEVRAEVLSQIKGYISSHNFYLLLISSNYRISFIHSFLYYSLFTFFWTLDESRSFNSDAFFLKAFQVHFLFSSLYIYTTTL